MTSGHSLRGAAAGECPRCDARTLFDGWVQFAPRCRSCGLDFSAFNVGDGPAAFLILIIGAVVLVSALFVDIAFAPPWWVYLAWVPITAGLTIAGLRFSKAWLLRQEYRHNAREGRIAE